ncbi:lipoprotein signal peptidase [Pseudohalioglobus sediminis]|uniref:Lipoprotein signal peptidase n=1 Tax=Pseudohalioglobus sediminis TaxID=2606449 RepID=A0A5B0WPH1_9GAMM|nr:signal peptidase II [Pseudohalioglobus sediminis]KAA1188348.1 lipoprotein signal peptidase [Pseudohalioglobus sediminis]
MARASSVTLRNGLQAWPWYLLALIVVLLDQYTKWLATAYLDYGRPLEVFSWFNLTLQHNTGAAFSFLSNAGGWQRWFFTAVAVIISTGLIVWLYMARRGHWLLALALGLILGGAIGNLWDRVALGYVVDFISVHYGGWYFPAFNIADSAITVGAGCMLLDGFIHREESDD